MTASDTRSQQLWYISFHGGRSSASINNVIAYDEGGREIGPVLGPGYELDELRGILPGDGKLYVANAHTVASAILTYGAADTASGKRPFLPPPLTETAPFWNPGLQHPFGLAWDREGNLYVSNQGNSERPEFTSSVTRYRRPGGPDGSEPMPLPPHLIRLPVYPGTFIAPAAMVQDGLKKPRGIAFSPDGFELFVADEGRDQVRRYDAVTGEYIGKLVDDRLDRPVHLLVDPAGQYLYVGSAGNNRVLRCELPSGKFEVFIDDRGSGLNRPAGMAWGADGDFYVASRKGQQILQFDARGKFRRVFLDRLKSNPEFIVPITI